MKIEELRNLSIEDLRGLLKNTQKKLFDLKIEAAQGRGAKSSSIREAKLTISRTKTLLKEREIREGEKT